MHSSKKKRFKNRYLQSITRTDIESLEKRIIQEESHAIPHMISETNDFTV